MLRPSFVSSRAGFPLLERRSDDQRGRLRGDRRGGEVNVAPPTGVPVAIADHLGREGRHGGEAAEEARLRGGGIEIGSRSGSGIAGIARVGRVN